MQHFKRCWVTLYKVEKKRTHNVYISTTQLLNATGIEGGIHDRQVLKYQPSVTSRLTFQNSMIVNGI